VTKQKKHKEGPLEKKWGFYTGTGINAKKGKDALVLREKLSGGEFAIVQMFGGCWTSSPMKVIEEIKTSNLQRAHTRFNEVAAELGFKSKPIRTIVEFFH